jgi:hypothetical protein
VSTYSKQGWRRRPLANTVSNRIVRFMTATRLHDKTHINDSGLLNRTRPLRTRTSVSEEVLASSRRAHIESGAVAKTIGVV